MLAWHRARTAAKHRSGNRGAFLPERDGVSADEQYVRAVMRGLKSSGVRLPRAVLALTAVGVYVLSDAGERETFGKRGSHSSPARPKDARAGGL